MFSNVLHRIRVAIQTMEINARKEFSREDTPIYDQLEREWVRHGRYTGGHS